jgi:hypothetical protein
MCDVSMLKHILGQPEIVEGVGEIHPVQLKNYDLFIECSNCLYYTIRHFEEEYQKYPLLELLVVGIRSFDVISNLTQLFSIVTKRNCTYSEPNLQFILEDGKIIDSTNYEIVREIVMRQNLMFEQKIYSDPRVQAAMIKAFEAKNKSNIRIEIEDIVTTVSVFSGKHYWELSEYTIYQLRADFNRISKLKKYDTDTLFKTVSTEKFNIEYFAEHVDMFKSPYDLDNFTKSKDQVNKLDSALGK